MKTYRQRVHSAARIIGLILAALLILWATLVGLGYAFVAVMNITAILMIVALATTVLTRAKKAQTQDA